MNRNKIGTIIITFMLVTTLLTVFNIPETVKADPGNPDNCQVWFSSDWHRSDNTVDIADVNSNCNITLGFGLGDMVNDGEEDGDWSSLHSGWDSVTGTGTITYKNYTHGNHEHFYWRDQCPGGSPEYNFCDWINRSRLCPTYEGWMGNFYEYLNDSHLGANYTYQYGNLLFICFGIDHRTCIGGEDVHSIEGWIPWINETVQANQDKNIILLHHVGIEETDNPDYYSGYEEQDDLYWMMQNYNIFASVHGHIHGDPTVKERYGTYHINDGKFSNPTYNSIMLNFTNGSSTVNIVTRQSGSGDYWDETIDEYEGTSNLYDTLTLDFPFDPNYENDSEDSIQFVSIDEGGNGTVIYDSTPVVAWTQYQDAIKYHLMISNISDFSTWEVNLSNISYSEFPSNYVEYDNQVNFTLPDSFALATAQNYYFRVRADYIG